MADWSTLSPERFEQLCTEILQSEGFYTYDEWGGSGDRGRDILAQKETLLLFGTKEVQNWVVQCKRFVSTNLSVDDIGTELNKVRMHKLDDYLIIVSNTILPAVHDWLTGVESQYTFKIKLFDLDWFELQMKRLPDLNRFFEVGANIPTRGSVRKIHSKVDLTIYTAGKMSSEAERGAVTWWRAAIEKESARLQKSIGFYHPEFAGCDHSGIDMAETVQHDFQMIYNSNLIIVYLNNEDQFGTMTEIMIGYSLFKQIAIFIDESIQKQFSCENTTDDGNSANQQYYDEVYSQIFQTAHSCPCTIMNDHEPIHVNNYWFMIEFLRLRQPDAHIQITNRDNVTKDMLKYLKKYAL